MLISPAGPLFVQRQLIISAPVRGVWMLRQGVWALVRRWDLTTMCFQRCGGERLTAVVGFNTGLRRRQALHSIRMPQNNTLTAHSAENPRAGEEHERCECGTGVLFIFLPLTHIRKQNPRSCHVGARHVRSTAQCHLVATAPAFLCPRHDLKRACVCIAHGKRTCPWPDPPERPSASS